jgi:hypothetical protein
MASRPEAPPLRFMPGQAPFGACLRLRSRPCPLPSILRRPEYCAALGPGASLRRAGVASPPLRQSVSSLQLRPSRSTRAIAAAGPQVPAR